MLLIVSDVQCGCLSTGLGPTESQYFYNFLKNMNMKILVKSVPGYLVIIFDPSLWLQGNVKRTATFLGF
jgi:hypothetical protein